VQDVADTVLLVVEDSECAGARDLAARLSAHVVVLEAGALHGQSDVRRMAARVAEAALRQAAGLIVVACAASQRSSALAGELMASGPCAVVMVPADPQAQAA
jgi:hypothetical protein